MTESEAIEKLKAHIECESKRSSIEGCNEGCIDCELAYLQGTSKEHIESVKLAIQALEMVQKLSDRKMTTGVLENYMQFEDECIKKGFTFKSVIEAREKQIPKMAYHISPVDDNDNANVECPACHATTDYAVNVIKRGHCWKCGQLLDWSDDDEID